MLIPLVGLGAIFAIGGLGLTWWVAMGGLFHGGLAAMGVVEEARGKAGLGRSK